MRVWDVYPAIDLRGGRVVRLKQGDPARERIYHADPAEVARQWRAQGARWVHVVNLDAALGEDDAKNQAALERLHLEGLSIQLGGGLRDVEAMRRALDRGVARLVMGTAAVEDPRLVEESVRLLGADHVAVAIDARAGRVRTRGWTRGTDVSSLDLARRCVRQGVRWLVLTDITRDGMGSGLGVLESARIARETGVQVIASGGVSSLEDVQGAWQAGLAGVIIGRALYEGQVSLGDACAVGRNGAG